MDWLIFTARFRAKLELLARTATGHEARVLAAKVSLLSSSFTVLLALQFFPGYGHGTLIALSIGVLLLGAAVAYAVPAPFILLLKAIATNWNEVLVWKKPDKGE